MIRVRSGGVDKDIEYRENITIEDALRKAGINKRFMGKIFVGARSNVERSTVLQDDETVTVAPKIHNG